MPPVTHQVNVQAKANAVYRCTQCTQELCEMHSEPLRLYEVQNHVRKNVRVRGLNGVGYVIANSSQCGGNQNKVHISAA